MLVALAEIGDKTQLLALVLAARYRRPWTIFAGILVATLTNHAAAAWLGALVAGLLGDDALHGLLAIGFAAMAAWTLVPDKLSPEDAAAKGHGGVFLTAASAFFIAEMGDKTQIASVALAARYLEIVPVVAGTTIGMMLANAPVLWFGDRMASRLPLRAIRYGAAALFALLAIVTAANALGF